MALLGSLLPCSSLSLLHQLLLQVLLLLSSVPCPLLRLLWHQMKTATLLVSLAAWHRTAPLPVLQPCLLLPLPSLHPLLWLRLPLVLLPHCQPLQRGFPRLVLSVLSVWWQQVLQVHLAFQMRTVVMPVPLCLLPVCPSLPPVLQLSPGR